MSRKNSVSLDLFDDPDATTDMSADCYSRVIETKNMDKASLHLSWASGPVGEFQIQARVHKDSPWFNINASAAWSVSGSDSSATIVLNELPFTEIRLAYVRTSGSGTLTGYMVAKTVGA